jgi:hypothetical protein
MFLAYIILTYVISFSSWLNVKETAKANLGQRLSACSLPVCLVWLANIFCNTVSPCVMKNSCLISEIEICNAVSIWQYLSLWAAVQLNEEHQIKNLDLSSCWTLGEECLQNAATEIQPDIEKLHMQKECKIPH